MPAAIADIAYNISRDSSLHIIFDSRDMALVVAEGLICTGEVSKLLTLPLISLVRGRDDRLNAAPALDFPP
jgi:hypothetical protein